MHAGGVAHTRQQLQLLRERQEKEQQKEAKFAAVKRRVSEPHVRTLGPHVHAAVKRRVSVAGLETDFVRT